MLCFSTFIRLSMQVVTSLKKRHNRRPSYMELAAVPQGSSGLTHFPAHYFISGCALNQY